MSEMIENVLFANDVLHFIFDKTVSQVTGTNRTSVKFCPIRANFSSLFTV